MRKQLLLTVTMLLAFVSTKAQQSWNFKTVSDDDIEAIEGDATTWGHESSSSNNRYHLLPALEKGELKAGNTELEYAAGLLFTAPAGSANNGNVRIDVKNKRMWVAGSVRLFIPNVAQGTRITIIAKSSAGSSATDKARGINVSENVKPISGMFNNTSAEQVTNVGLVETEGDVELSFTGAMYLYELTLEDSDEDGESGDDTPEPTPTPSQQDNSTSANAMKNQVVLSTENGGTMIVELETVPEQESIFQILQLGAVPDQGA